MGQLYKRGETYYADYVDFQTKRRSKSLLAPAILKSPKPDSAISSSTRPIQPRTRPRP